jgi:hypothetical protein
MLCLFLAIYIFTCTQVSPCMRRCSNACNFKTMPLNTNSENYIYYLIQLQSIKTNKNPDPQALFKTLFFALKFMFYPEVNNIYALGLA